MATSQPDDQPVANPTYLGNIRGFFDDGEIACMNARGIDLASYDSVRHHATDIYEQTKAGNMPMGGVRWTNARVQTFLNWIKTGFPLGVAPAPPAPPAGGGPPAPGGDTPVLHPTYMADIRHYFRPTDIACMKPRGVDLGTYQGVRDNASGIYDQTKSHAMPMGGPPWSDAWVQTFQNWINDGFPLGAATPAAVQRLAAPIELPTKVRLRKNINALGQPEIDLLKKAFSGIMALDPKKAGDPVDPNSYFGLAAVHGLPNAYCMHHVDSYNPWHRVYMKTFEDALRSVPGCETVTLPYWDITQPVPAVLYEAPFANYTLPVDIGDPGTYPAGYVTQRNDPATIESKLLVKPSVPSDIAHALPASRWGAYHAGGFEGPIIAAHDDGHDSCGATMGDQDVAAYDPIFWFFHCNWDRLWESWQVLAGATTLPGFTSTLDGDTEWLSLALDPYAQAGDTTIVWPDVAYDELAGKGTKMRPGDAGHAVAARAFQVASATEVSLRVKDIDRMNIPGSFVVWLLADGQRIARRSFFQPRSPRSCATCRKQALISLDFRLDQADIVGHKLSIEVEVPSLGAGPKAILPLAEVGNPTINVRLLLSED